MTNMYLPIGSVVLLKNATKRLMIIAIKTTDTGSLIEYDYGAVLYPEGYISANKIYLFNNKDVAKVFYPGYDDDERRQFLRKLSESDNKQTGKNNPVYFDQK